MIWRWGVDKISGGDPNKGIGAVLQHSVPILLLLIEYIFCNAYPIMLRHMSATFSISFIYIVYNIIYTFNYRKVYPGWTWDSPKGIARPLSVIAGSIVVNILMIKINYYKLKKLGVENKLMTTGVN